MPFSNHIFSASTLGTSFLYSLILVIFSALKKNKTMMSAPFITLCSLVTALQFTAFLEWLWQPGVYPKPLFFTLLVTEYMLSYLASATYYWYVKTYVYALQHPEVSKRPESEKRTLLMVLLMGLAAAAMYISSIWTGWLYRLDEHGVLQYTPAYVSQFFVGSFWSALTLIKLIHHRRLLSAGQLALMLSYVVTPMIMFAADLFTGLSMGCVTAALTLFLIYTRIDNAQGERLLEQKASLAKKEAEMTETKMELMMSQIQPHFLYNALSSIAYLCTEDPAEAERATNEFSNYLKGNLQSINAKAPIPFEIEIMHVEQYLRIEKRRFFDRLNIVYDIREKDFRIPALTLQTLVENAVRYSVSAKYEPTTVQIVSEADENNYVVRIIDDGPGFDTSAKPSDDRRHIGLAGARYRLNEMVKGRLEISSVIGQGTAVTIYIPKEEQA